METQNSVVVHKSRQQLRKYVRIVKFAFSRCEVASFQWFFVHQCSHDIWGKLSEKFYVCLKYQILMVSRFLIQMLLLFICISLRMQTLWKLFAHYA